MCVIHMFEVMLMEPWVPVAETDYIQLECCLYVVTQRERIQMSWSQCMACTYRASLTSLRTACPSAHTHTHHTFTHHMYCMHITPAHNAHTHITRTHITYVYTHHMYTLSFIHTHHTYTLTFVYTHHMYTCISCTFVAHTRALVTLFWPYTYVLSSAGYGSK